MSYRFHRSDSPVSSLLVPCRMDVFADRDVPVGKRGKVVRRVVGWQGWNPDPSMEQRMARLQGAGSFYWPNAIRVLAAARQMMHADETIQQIKLETISGQEIGRVWR